MTLQIDPQAYYKSGTECGTIAADIRSAAKTLVGVLDGCAGMAGSTDASTKWAKTYDANAGTTIQAAYSLADALDHFGGLLVQAGYNHALADYNANRDPNKGAAPVKPPGPPPPAQLCWAGAPSAGGRGEGLEKPIPGLLEAIGVAVPDGNTEKLQSAEDAWRTFAQNRDLTDAAGAINRGSAGLGDLRSPELSDVADHLSKLKNAATTVEVSAEKIRATVADYHHELSEFRSFLHRSVTELAATIAVGVAFNIFADCVTGGVAVILNAASAAKAAEKIRNVGRRIRDAIVIGRLAQKLESGAKTEVDLDKTTRELDEIKYLEKEKIEEVEGSALVPKSDVKLPSPSQAQDIIAEADRTGTALNKSDKYHRAASFPVDEIGSRGSIFGVVGGDGIRRTLVQMPGELDGVTGRFEWIIDNGKVTHQLFVRNGTINGVPTKP